MNHRCTVGELSYEQVNEGTIWCRVCGRIYDLTDKGWKPDPYPPMSQSQLQAINRKRYAGKR